MKAFTNANPRDLAHALTLVQQAQQDGKSVALAGGGSDLLGMMKERLVAPDVLVNLKSAKGLDQITPDRGGGIAIGGLMTLDALSRHATIRSRYPVLAEAAESVAEGEDGLQSKPRRRGRRGGRRRSTAKAKVTPE